jgi:hypothetical protein
VKRAKPSLFMFSKNINGLNNKKKFKHGTKYLKTEINNYI